MQFAWLEDDEELRRVIEGGDFAKWRVFLHPEQRRYVESSCNGPFRLSGGAGTGKTVVLLHRARALARRDPQARVVLTTYTRNLADSMRRDLLLLDPSLRSSVLEGGDYVDLGEEATDDSGYRSARSGPAPTRVPTESLTQELDRATAQVRDWLDAGVQPDTIGILVRDQRTSDRVVRGFEDRGVKIRQITRGATSARHPQLMTMHRAKGMEFSRVLIFGADADLVPAAYLLRGVAEGDREDMLQWERSLFYVAATRARDELVVMWEGEGSDFLSADAPSTSE